jgi:divalent metal cation (Fe/Co/Zn/Cd) transporter
MPPPDHAHPCAACAAGPKGVLEDSAALVGIALALSALVLHITTGSALWDGAASVLIGLLLIVVAYLLMRRNLALLIDEAAPADIRERLRQAVAQEPWVAEGAELTANLGRLRRRLLAVPAIAAVEITPVERAQ